MQNDKLNTFSQPLTVPQALRRAKDIAGETDRSLASKSGIPEHTVAKIMSGATQDPTFYQVAAMAAVLDLDLNALAGFPSAAVPGDAAVAQARLDGAQELNDALRDRNDLYERGIRQRNLTICVLLGFVAFFGVAFFIYVAADFRDTQHGFIRTGGQAHWFVALLILVLCALILGHIKIIRRFRSAKKPPSDNS